MTESSDAPRAVRFRALTRISGMRPGEIAVTTSNELLEEWERAGYIHILDDDDAAQPAASEEESTASDQAAADPVVDPDLPD